MKNRFTLTQCIVILILSLLTALEPLCIDLYLPGFVSMQKSLATSSEAIKISLSTFLAGFALGQLIWGPLADKFGRKKPILASLGIFVIASTACMFVQTIEQLWVIRFIQALSGCGGVVISRAVVTDSFHKDDTLKVFSLLALIMGIAPIIAPGIGNMVMIFFDWRGLFGTMALLGAFMFILTILFLPESYKPSFAEKKSKSVVKDYIEVLKVKPFVIYSLLSGIVNGALMLYISNGSFLIVEKGGYSGTEFSIIFGINALGVVGGSLFASFAQRYMPTRKLLKLVVILELLISIVVLAFMYLNVPFTLILIAVFFFIVPLGVLFPVTTELALTPFSDNGGTASALFGSIQLSVAFVATILASALTDVTTMTSVGVSFFLCSLMAFFTVFYKIKPALT